MSQEEDDGLVDSAAVEEENAEEDNESVESGQKVHLHGPLLVQFCLGKIRYTNKRLLGTCSSSVGFRRGSHVLTVKRWSTYWRPFALSLNPWEQV